MLSNAIRGLATEFGLTVSKGTEKLDELVALVGTDETIPMDARHAIAALRVYCNDLVEGIEIFEAKIVAHARHDQIARRVATIPGIGPITASLIAASVVDIGLFSEGAREGNASGSCGSGVIRCQEYHRLVAVLLFAIYAVLPPYRAVFSPGFRSFTPIPSSSMNLPADPNIVALQGLQERLGGRRDNVRLRYRSAALGAIELIKVIEDGGPAL